MTKAEVHDLHEGFRDPHRVPAGDLERFLEQAGTPFSFALNEAVWRRIVYDTLAAGAPLEPAITTWLGELAAAAARGEFVTAITGILTAGSRP
jgi:hypothetical protein